MLRCAIAFSAAVLAGCSAVENVVMPADRPTAEVAAVTIDDLSLDGLRLTVAVDVSNPYETEIPLSFADYGFASDGTPFLAGELPLAGAIPAYAKRTVMLETRFDVDVIRASLPSARPGDVIPFDAQLGVVVRTPVNAGGMRIPLETSSSFPLVDAVRVELIDVLFDEVNLTQVRGRIRFELEHDNTFAVTVASISTTLRDGASAVVTTDAEPGVSVRIDRPQRLDVPFVFSPLDATPEGLTRYRDDQRSYRATGRMTINTPYGHVDVTF